MTAVAEEIPPQVPSLPRWPDRPGPVDASGTSFLVLAIGGGAEAAAVARRWAAEAEGFGPTTLGVLGAIDDPGDLATFENMLGRARTGVRVMVAGGQFDVLQALARLRQRGAIESELTSHVTDLGEIPVFCAHCQTIFRVVATPGGAATCAACERPLVVHEHMAAQLGGFLASYTGEAW